MLAHDEFRSTIISKAREAGWAIAGLGVSDGDGGFPDLVMSRKGTIFYINLCSINKPLTNQKIAWMQSILGNTKNCEVWTPVDWVRIRQVLKGAA